jgi:GNAT superfamily N-acetyltransferase
MQLAAITEQKMQTLSDALWKVIYDTAVKYDKIAPDQRIRRYIEQNAEITPFDGGAFVAVGNEFDLYVLPEKQGKWRIRNVLNDYLAKMTDKYGALVVKIHEDNHKSLRLAKFFKFKEVSRIDGKLTLERKPWDQ